MLPKRLRLSRQTFPKTPTGKSVSSTYFSLVSGPSSKGGCTVVVSKKVAKRAVDRHLIKRRTYSLMKPYCRSSRYVIIYAKMGAGTLSFKELSSELTHLLSRLP